jgi:curved DNA-binding protein CbpA
MPATDAKEKEAYKDLRLPEGASQEEIKRQHRKLVRRFHSDVNTTGDEDELKKVNRAYETLTNESKRKARAAEKAKTEADKRAEQARAARADRARSAAQAQTVGDQFRSGTTRPAPFGGSSGAYRSSASGMPPTGTRPSTQPTSVPSSPPVTSAYWLRALISDTRIQDLLIVLLLMFLAPFVLLHFYVLWYADFEHYINSGLALQFLGAAVYGATLLVGLSVAFGGLVKERRIERTPSFIAALAFGFIYIARLASLLVWGHTSA